jgi:hypothetical protein
MRDPVHVTPLPTCVEATTVDDRTRFALASRRDAISLLAALRDFRPFIVALDGGGFAVHCRTSGTGDRRALEATVEAWAAVASHLAA